VHHSSTATYLLNYFIEIEETFCGRMGEGGKKREVKELGKGFCGEGVLPRRSSVFRSTFSISYIALFSVCYYLSSSGGLTTPVYLYTIIMTAMIFKHAV